MSDFERELREAKLQAEREARLKILQVEQEEAERQRRIEQAVTEAKIKHKLEVERHVLPVKPMVDRLLRVLGNATWGVSNHELSFVEGHQSPSAKWDFSEVNILAEWRVGRTIWYNQPSGLKRLLGGKGDLMNPSKSSASEIDPSKGYLNCFALAFRKKDGGFLFSVPRREGETTFRTDAEIGESELSHLLKDEFIKGPHNISWPSLIGDWSIRGG